MQVQGGVLSEGHRSALDAIGEVLSMEVASSLGSADLGTSHMDPTHTAPYSQRGRGRGRGRGCSPAGKCKAQALPWTRCLGVRTRCLVKGGVLGWAGGGGGSY